MANPVSPNQPIPNLDAPMVNANGTLALAWYRLLVNLWQKLGSQFSNTRRIVYIEQSDAADGNPLSVYNAITGQLLGHITMDP